MHGQFYLEDLRPDYYEVCLISYDTDGCVDTTCQDIEVLHNVGVWIPTSFTPDGDGLNDELQAIVNGYDLVENFSFTVYDRRGHIVFETEDPARTWNGIDDTVYGIMQGVYQWDVRYKVFGENSARLERGTVTLIK